MIKPTIIGWREWVGLPELQSGPLLAKIDTGAWSNTMHAIEIEIVEGGLENRVRFRQEDEGPIIERPLHKWRRVRDTGGHESMRPVIRTTLEIASLDFDIEMCLADRSRMRHRLILGRNFLRLGFIVNPSRQCVHTMIRSDLRATMERTE